MNKKIIYSVIAAICVAQCGVLPVSAMETDSSGTDWYTASELLERWSEEKSIRDETCNRNVECERELWKGKTRDKKYRIMSNFVNQFVHVTNINPGEGTIDIVFFGDKIFSETSYRINRMRVAWADDGRDNLAANLTNFFADESIAVFYDGSEEANGRGWIPKEEQVELVATSDARLSDNNGILHVGVNGGGFGVNLRVDYTSCLNDSRYRTGMNCQMWYSLGKGVEYRLVADGNTEDGSGDGEEGSNDMEEDIKLDIVDDIAGDDSGYEYEKESSSAIEEGDAKNGEEVVAEYDTDGQRAVVIKDEDVSEIEGKSKNIILTNNDQKETKNETKETQELVEKESNIVEAQYVDPKMENLDVELPNLGGENCEKNIDFPWWFLVILAVGDVILVWLWTPKREKR